MSRDVYITKLSKYLPNAPISNDEIETYLGKINNNPSKARRVVLKSNGIKTRYYALDKEGNSTHSNAQLTALAIQGLFTDKEEMKQVELLACGTGTPDQLIPSHASMVHGLIDAGEVELYALGGTCCTGIQSLKAGYMSILSGNTSNAVCTGSERISKSLRSDYYEEEAENYLQMNKNPYIAFEKDFLRWMLSDGACSVFLETQPQGDLSLKVEWIEMTSFAHEEETCMYSGGEKNDAGDLIGWYEFSQSEWLNKSLLSIKQDVKLLKEKIVTLAVRFLKKLVDKRGLDVDRITYFLPHISSEFFRSILLEGYKEAGIEIPASKWFTNLTRIGNIGSASSFLMLEELFHSGKLKKGDTILLFTPESARFSYGYTLLTVV